MPHLTEYVLETALAQVARWRAQGLFVPVAVNVSPRDVHTPGFAGSVAARLARHGVPAGALQLEITEHVLLEDPQRAADTLAGLTGHGVKMSLDDFGTGYSSLVHLRKLPVSELKIDRSFVARLAIDNEDAEIVRCTIDLAHSLGLVVVAEGVEDDETWERLRDLHCDAVQGWLVAAAMPPQETTAWLRARGEHGWRRPHGAGGRGRCRRRGGDAGAGAQARGTRAEPRSGDGLKDGAGTPGPPGGRFVLNRRTGSLRPGRDCGAVAGDPIGLGQNHTPNPEDRCMPGITREEVAHLARLARLELKGEELEHFAGQLDDIIGAVARVSEVADQDVPPTSHPLPLTNVMRADEVRPSLTPAQALSGAPAQEQQRFKVPQILGED